VHRFRDHFMTFSNPNSVALHDIRFEAVLPEVVLPSSITAPRGVDVRCKPREFQIQLGSTAPSISSSSGESDGCQELSIVLDRLMPKRELAVELRTRLPRYQASLESIAQNNSGEKLRYYLLGDFQYEERSEFSQVKILVPLTYDPAARIIRSLPCLEDTGEQPLLLQTTWGV